VLALVLSSFQGTAHRRSKSPEHASELHASTAKAKKPKPRSLKRAADATSLESVKKKAQPVSPRQTLVMT
jgi:hypothetical protein